MNAKARSSAAEARRNHLPRTVGLALGFLFVATVFVERGAAPPAWALLFLYAFAWPHVARALALNSEDPHRAEIRNLMVDAAFGGAWVVLMGFSLLPSVLLIAMLSMTNIGAGGARLLLAGAVSTAVGGGLAAAGAGVSIEPAVSMAVLLASLPMLVVYPLMIGMATYRLADRLARERAEFERLSRTDGLSGLYNRLHWDERVVIEFARLQRHGGESTLLMLDIDHFKEYNDARGHPGGDEAIRLVARVLRQESRMEDGIARCGGEEFGVLLPEVGRDSAEAAAERLRVRIEEAGRAIGGITVSIGAAPFDPALVDADEWILRADRALYAAKRAGRNRCAVDGARVAGELSAA